MKEPKHSTLQIKLPFGRTLLFAVLFLVVLIGLGEVVLRVLPAFSVELPPSSLGFPDRMFELKLPRLEESVADRGGVDLIFLGPSIINQGVNAELFEREYADLTGQPVRVFNMAINALQNADANVIARYLWEQYQPCLIVYGTTPRNYDIREDTVRFVENVWLRYQLGEFSVDGWMRDRFLTYQYSLILRNWMKEGFRDEIGNRLDSQRNLTPLGFLPTDEVMPEISEPPSLDIPWDEKRFIAFEDYAFNPDGFETLEDMLALRAAGANFLLLEAPAHPSFVAFFPNQWEDHTQFINELSQFAEAENLPFWPTLGYVELPDEGWRNRNHLNTVGAEIFTRWLAAQMADSGVLEGLGEPGGCAAMLNPDSSISDDWSLPPIEKDVPAFRVDLNKNGLIFAGFVLVVLAVYYLLPHRPQNIWLLLASYAFYFTWAWEFVLVLLALTLVNYALGRRMQAQEKGRKKTALLWLGLGFNITILGFFKYTDFFLPQMLTLLARMGIQTEAGGLQILLPVGLSYLVVQAIAYLIDVARGHSKAAPDLADFALYLGYFPKLISGPIERAMEFLPRLAQPRLVDNAVLARNFTLIVVGAIRKFVLADALSAMFPDQLFISPSQYPAPVLIFGIIGYAFFLYNDFAGYTNIVRGVSGLMGIELMPNFQSPFFSRNFTELWNRWHISLSQWMRGYIFFPLTRALLRRFKRPDHVFIVIFPPMVTMLASGLWHGANWNMLIWGFLNGVFHVAERISILWGVTPVSPDKRPYWRQVLAMWVVVGLALLAAVPFRMEMPVALEYWRGLIAWNGWLWPDIRMVALVLGSLLVDWVQARQPDEAVFLKWRRPLRAVLLALAVLAVFFVTRADVGAPFVYQGF